jgi:hypothetical protein
MPELILNLHMHTTYSDGSGRHASIAHAALQSGLDAVIVTDHNVLVRGIEGYRQEGQRQLMLLVGEEVHNQVRDPQKSHLLVFGANRELASFAPNPQRLVDMVNQSGGLAFIAHPIDPELRAFHEEDISWVDWEVRGFTGLELWNGFSELKTVVHNRAEGLFYAFFPQFLARGPLTGALRRWDELLTTRREKCAVVGGSDAHALRMRMGPLRRTIFPYEFHFQAINNHVLLDDPLRGDFQLDKQAVHDALRQGHSYIGYDLAAPTAGFRFTANGHGTTASMGDEIPIGPGLTFQIKLPAIAECRLICNGEVVKTWIKRDVCTYIATKPGIYRVECYIQYLGRRRGWIFSNPIYVRN